MPDGPGPELRADCSRCAGLCCVALPFARSADFPVDKAAGVACRHLLPSNACGIHSSLLGNGFRGCTVFDCLGAGQRVTQVTFVGRDWRDDPATARRMFDAFAVMRQLHELLWYLTQALALGQARALHPSLTEARERVERATDADAETLARLDLTDVRRQVDDLLRRTSRTVRLSLAGPRPVLHRADLVGQDLRAADLRGADLRGALLIAADLRAADLRGADLIGADLRDADLRGADLRSALFVTPPQLAAADGDGATRLPDGLDRPGHW